MGPWVEEGDWSSPTLLREGIVLIPAVGAVGGGGGTAGREGPGVASLWAGWVLESVS